VRSVPGAELPRPLAGKVAVVTGASGDIGGATARRLAELGASVGLNYWSNESGAARVLQAIEGRGGKAVLLRGDVRTERGVAEMVTRVRSALGPVTLLVNNAGFGAEHNQVEDLTLDEWNRVIATNLTAAFLCTKAFVPGMLQQGGGRIVNVSSICGLSGDCDPAYSASKAGLLGLTRSCAARLAPTIQVNAVLPGFVGTKYHEAHKDLVRGVAPDGRLAAPEEISEVIGFLLSTSSGFLTGACLPIDGGASVASLGMHMDWIRGK
jgi:3-oxoacyl-[acyl-carrier protein] reductase